jgi:nucleoside phosphorylase
MSSRSTWWDSSALRARSWFLVRAVTSVLILAAAGCGDGDDDGESSRLLILSAFPGELVPLLEQAEVEDTAVVNERVFRIGSLRGVPVVLGLTGIGLFNATNTTRAALEQFAISGIVFSGVAGTPLRIGDVTVPVQWAFSDGATYGTSSAWIDVVGGVVASGSVRLDRCTELPDEPSREVCLPHEPAIVVGSIGRSEGFPDTAFACGQVDNDVFACDVPATTVSAGSRGQRERVATRAQEPEPASVEDPIAVDMETTAVAREAEARGLPFIAFRAASDGEGDPLSLPGFPAQFFAYYRLAARNAAAVTIAFLERL